MIVFVEGAVLGGGGDGGANVVSAKRMSSKSTSKGSAIRDNVVHVYMKKSEKESVSGVVKVMWQEIRMRE